jgi:hypothetical protein
MNGSGPDRLAGLRPEDRLLVECSRLEIDAAGAERIRSLVAGGLDWDAALEASIRHNVAPLVSRALGQVDARAAGLPEPVAEALDALRATSERRNRRLFQTIGEVVAAMRAEGVEPVGLKDIQLAAELYPEGLRPMGDIDLLIRREDWSAAVAALDQLGFEARPGADVPYMRAYAISQHFRRASDEVWIDLQWNVLEREWDHYGEGRFTYDGALMWERSEPMLVDGYEIRVPCLEDMLFHLALHLEGHLYSELVLFTDIAELLRVRAGDIRWPLFLDITRQYRAESSVYYVLLLVERLLGAPVPEDVMSALEPEYFHGGLFGPLFTNLTPLHNSLDEIRLAVDPPQPLLDELEQVARRQGVRARRLEAELDTLATSFVQRGGRLILFEGARSRRVFPDPAVPAFEPLHAFVLADDAPLLDELVQPRRVLPLATVDPVLNSDHAELVLTTEHSSDLAGALAAADHEELTNARSALESLRARMRGGGRDDASATATLVVHALDAEELLTCVAAQVGAAGEERLFRLVALLEVLRGLPTQPDPARVAELAARHGVTEAVSAGLLVAGGLADDVPAPPLDPSVVSPPRVLEWGRYGPSSLRRYPWLRSAYYFAFALIASGGGRPRLRYLRRSLAGRRTNGQLPVLPGLAAQIVTGSLRSRGADTRSIQEMAYWIDEPRTIALVERRLSQPASG